MLSGLKERLAAGRHSLSKRMFKRQPKGHSPSKGELKTTVHVRGPSARPCQGGSAAEPSRQRPMPGCLCARRRPSTSCPLRSVGQSPAPDGLSWRPLPSLPVFPPSSGWAPLPLQEMQDQLTSSEEEKNALKRQLAKLTKKYQQARALGFFPLRSFL